MKKASKREAKCLAQDLLMHGIGNVLGYWMEDVLDTRHVAELGYTNEEFGAILLAQADRVAKLFGFDEAWSN